MLLKNLLANGYFSEELPPPFFSDLLSTKYRKVLNIISSLPSLETKKLAETECVRYSIPKVGLHRRVNGIPNPYHYTLLVRAISQNWNSIKGQYKKSKFSVSIPKIDSSGKRAIVQLSRYEQFKEKCIEASFDSYFELKADIAKYFHSIYTHSIPWALHSKAVAKRRRRDPTLLGNILDASVRYGQSGQTIGIPIGTDTSRIIAELIGCSIDESLLRELTAEKVVFKGHRFVDDCHYFFRYRADAEKALKHFQKILIDFSLNINEEKTSINEAPFCFENYWNQDIISFKLRIDPQFQRLDLRNYFNLVIKLSKQYPNDYVIKYAIKKYKKFKISHANWSLYESLLYSLVVAEGAILPDFLSVLLQNQKAVNRKKLESVLHTLLNQHVNRGNHFEVSWCLWIAKSFKIRIPKPISEFILDSKDIISILILLDLKDNKLTASTISISKILPEFTQDGLINEFWLLVYEASHKGWVRSSALNTIQFFNQMSLNGISFYDSNRQIVIENPNIKRYATLFKTKVAKKDEEEKTTSY
jgi:hypothetical protein